jgi:glycerate kinase
MASRRKPLAVLLAPSGFKENIDAETAAEAMAKGVRRYLPDAKLILLPIADGGEGFARTLVRLTRGKMDSALVRGPLRQRIRAPFGMLGGRRIRTAVLEISAAAGLRLVPPARRDPRFTSSYGVGQLVRAALDRGARALLIGCGDSGVNDGGIGLARALGVKLLDRNGKSIGEGGSALARLRDIDLSRRDPRIAKTRIRVALNWNNVLLGPRGVARVYGPQKGATPAIVAELEDGMANFAAVVKSELGIDLKRMPGAGASGGLGAGMHAFLDAELHPRFRIVEEFLDLDWAIRQADVILTAEGTLDGQSCAGKVPAELARRARPYGKPVIAVAGALGRDVRKTLDIGINAYFCMQEKPSAREESFAEAPRLLADATEQVIRLISIGRN